MNIKSLLIGSAAALVAVTGARAADAVMAPEPEPVEYVRVCDAYGAGFFYIPGTETCLKISGYVWYQIAASSMDTQVVNFPGPGGLDTPSAITGAAYSEGWYKNIRARVNFDARSETEWGTLQSYIRIQGSGNGTADLGTAVDQAYITLGGLFMGYSESFWVDSKSGGASNYGSHSWTGMDYGYQQRAIIGYRFESNGFFGALSLEDDALNSFGATAANAATGAPALPGYAAGNYMPDVVAKVGYTGGWGTVWVKVGYDEDRTNSFTSLFAPLQAGDNGWGAQVGAQINVPNMPGSSLRVLGFYADSDNAFGTGSRYGALFNALYGVPTSLVTAPAFGSAEWSILASYNHQFTESLGASVAFQYFSDFYLPGTDLSSGIDGWSTELSVVWFPVKDFEVRGEVRYDEIDDIGAIPVDGTVSGFLRFTRYF